MTDWLVKDLFIEGKSKNVYNTSEIGVLMIEYTDKISAFDWRGRLPIEGKGQNICAQSIYYFRKLANAGIPNHCIGSDYNHMYVKQGYTRPEQKTPGVIPLEMIFRNRADGSYLERHPEVDRFSLFDEPILEFHEKDDAIHDPLISEEDIVSKGILTHNQLETVKDIMYNVIEVMCPAFEKKGIFAIDGKLEMAWVDGKIVVADDSFNWESNRQALIKPFMEENKVVYVCKEIYRDAVRPYKPKDPGAAYLDIPKDVEKKIAAEMAPNIGLLTEILLKPKIELPTEIVLEH